METESAPFTREEFASGWRDKAACRGKGSEMFHQEIAGGNAFYLEARALCFNCPVQQECFDFAVRHSIQHGLWGGFTYRERLAAASGKRPRKVTIMDVVRSSRRNTTIKALAELLKMAPEQVTERIKEESQEARRG